MLTERSAFLGHLKAALSGFASGGDALLAHRRAMLELAEAHGSASLRRDHFDPGHFTASGFVLDETGTRLLLIHHAKLDLWLQPGGHVEATDETFVEAARREVEEETGLRELCLEAELCDLDVHEIPAFGSAPGHLHHDLRALFRAGPGVSPVARDVLAARWFSLDELAHAPRSDYVLSDGVSTDRSVVAAALALVRRQAR